MDVSSIGVVSGVNPEVEGAAGDEGSASSLKKRSRQEFEEAEGCEAEDGKTHRDWFVTVFHYEKDTILTTLVAMRPSLSHYSIGFEKCPETGRDHFHAVLRFKSPVRFAKLRGICPKGKGKINWLKANVYFHKRVYTQKDGVFEEWGQVPLGRVQQGSINIGERNEKLSEYRELARQGKFTEIPETEFRVHYRYYRTLRDEAMAEAGLKSRVEWAKEIWSNRSLHAWQTKLLARLKEPSDERKILWVYDPDGGAGKTQFCDYVEHVCEMECQVLQPMKGADLAHLLVPNMPIYFFDIPRVSGEHVPWGLIENLKNGRVISGKYQGANKFFRPPHVVVMSNALPPETTSQTGFSSDRIDIISVI